MSEYARKAVSIALLLLAGSRIELLLQQEGFVNQMCVAEQQTYLDSEMLPPGLAKEVKKMAKEKLGK